MPEPAPIPEVVVPPLPGDWTYRYYYTAEFPFGRAPSRYVRRRRLAEIAPWMAQEKARVALELGCGPAELSTLIRKVNAGACQVVSLDLGLGFVPLATAIAQANGGQLEFVLGNATALPFPGDTFDLVVTTEMLEHVPQWSRVIAEAARVLRPNGVLIISTPTRAGFHSWLKRAWQWLTGWEKVNQACLRGEGQDYEKFLSAREVITEARRLGFQLDSTKVKIFVFSFLPPALLGLNRLAETLLEALPGLKQLGVTRFYQFRKVSGR